MNPETQVQKNVIDTKEWPQAVRRVQIELRQGEEILEQEYRSRPQLVGGTPNPTGGGALVLTTERLVVASPGKGVWACDLKRIDRAYLSLGAGNYEWVIAIAFLPPALPLTLLLLLTRRLAVEYRDDAGQSKTTRIHLSRPAYWMDRINALKSGDTAVQITQMVPESGVAAGDAAERLQLGATVSQQQPQATEPNLDAQLEQLERLAALREKGILTEEEFQAKKRTLLDG